MKQQLLNVETREKTGRGPCRQLRANNRIPAVVYGESGASHLSVSQSDLRQLLRKIQGTAALINLKFADNRETLSVVQEIISTTTLFMWISRKWPTAVR